MDADKRIAELETEVASKDARLAEQDARIAELEALVSKLLDQVAQLTERLGENSGNSSKPPSNDPPGAGSKNRNAAELNLGRVAGQDGELSRELSIGTISARFRFSPEARWRWSAVLGLGSAHEEMEVLNGEGAPIVAREFEHGVIAVGVALERRFGHFGIGAEL